MAETIETVLESRQAPTRHVVTLQALHGAPGRVTGLLARLPGQAAVWQPAPETWNAHMLVAHLAGSEGPFLKRLEHILAEANPYVPYFGPDVARPDAPGTLDELLEQFLAGRQALVRRLVELAPEDWERPAVHETMGPTTLALQAQNMTKHDADHLAQLAALAQAWEQASHG